MNRKIEFFPSKFENNLGEIEVNGEIEVKSINFKISNNFGELIKSFKCGSHFCCFGHHPRRVYISPILIGLSIYKLISARVKTKCGKIKIWDLQSGECLKTLNEHKDCVTSILIYKNNKFISGSDDETIKIWDLESYECIETLENNCPVSSLLLLSNLLDNNLASGSTCGTINIWNLNEKKIVKTITEHNYRIRSLIKTKDSSKFISGSNEIITFRNWIDCKQANCKIKIWDSNNFQLLREIPQGHSGGINCLKILNDETFLSGSRDEIKIWKIDSGECLKTLNFNGSVDCFETFNNDKMLIIGTDTKPELPLMIERERYNRTGTGTGDVIIYDLNKYEEVKRINSAHTEFVSRLILLSNGNLLTAGGDDDDIKQWNFLESE